MNDVKLSETFKEVSEILPNESKIKKEQFNYKNRAV